MAATIVNAPLGVSHTQVDRRPLLLVAAALMAVSAGIHVLVLPEHLGRWLPAGLFFLVIAAGQGWLAEALLRRPSPRILSASIWSSIAIIGVYVWSRTAGLPFAPVHAEGGHSPGGSHAGHAVGGHGNGVPIFPGTGLPSRAEAVGGLDLTALAAELTVVALLVYLLPLKSRGWTCNAILACGLAMWVLRATAVLP